MKRIAILTVTMLAMASCVGPRQPAPAPTPAPTPAPRPTPAPTPVPAERYSGDWSVDPLTPAGDWQYQRGGGALSSAVFSAGNGNNLLVIACQSGGTISLTRFGNPVGRGEIRIRTSFGERPLPTEQVSNDRAMFVRLPARDQLWDQIAFSRGRFLVEATRQAPMIVPARPEIGRVIEDCRG